MIKLRVTGMTCEHCVRAVTKALSGVPGVTKVVGVSLSQGMASVEGAPNVAALIAAVREQGYEAEELRP